MLDLNFEAVIYSVFGFICDWTMSVGCQVCASRIRELCFIFGINASHVEALLSRQTCKQGE